jgi:uncharacterized protein (TIGR02271 family)
MLQRFSELEQDYQMEPQDMRGYDAYDSQGEKVGEVKDLVADTDTNIANYALIGGGWLAGIFQQREIIAPLRKMDIDDEEGAVHLDLPKERLQDFPSYDSLDEPGLQQKVATFWGEGRYRRPLEGEQRWGRPTTIPVVEEQARVEKEVEKTGEVAVTKEEEVERRPITEEVRGEKVEVERHKVPEKPLSEYEKEGRQMQPGETVSIPVTEERIRVTKEPVVVEEIVLSKVPTSREVKTEAELHKERIEVDERKKRGAA